MLERRPSDPGGIKLVKQFKLLRVISKVLNPGRRIEIRFIRQHLDIRSTDVVLDIGCGDGFWTNQIASGARSGVGIDPNDDDIQAARRYANPAITFQQGLAEHLPFPDRSFSKVMSVCVFEHVSDDLQTFKEIYRVLKDGGVLAATVDSLNSPSIPESHRQWHVERWKCNQLYDSQSITTKLRKAGFRSVSTSYLMSSFPAVMWEILFERFILLSIPLGLFIHPFISLAGWKTKKNGYKLFVHAIK